MLLRCAHCSAVEVLLCGEDPGLVLRNALDLVSPFACNLYSSLYSLSTSVHGQDHLETQHRGDLLSEAGEDIVVECARAERQSRGLGNESLDEFGVAVTLVHGAVCGEEIEVVVSCVLLASRLVHLGRWSFAQFNDLDGREPSPQHAGNSCGLDSSPARLTYLQYYNSLSFNATYLLGPTRQRPVLSRTPPAEDGSCVQRMRIPQR